MQLTSAVSTAAGGPVAATSSASSNNNTLASQTQLPSMPAAAATTPPSLPSHDNNTNGENNNSGSGELFQPPLHTDGRYIRDARGRRFKLAAVNWYGGSDELFIPSGLDKQPRRAIAALLRRMGFNTVRMPYSDEMVMRNPTVPDELLAANRDLEGRPALDIFTACVEALTDAGLAVIVNNHITAARWCDGKSLCDAAWKNDHLGPFCKVKLTEEQWMANWETIMRPLVDNARVIGCDLRNEVRGVWGTMNWNMWATAAEKCGDRLHARLSERWLMFVEGIGSANDCSGARNRPVVLRVPRRLVYSVHVFAWSGWGSLDPYSRRPYPGFALAMHRNWAYLLRERRAPVWIGEMGAGRAPGKGETHYWNNLMRFLDELDVDFGYWAVNPRKPHENEVETWGLTDDAWSEIIEDYRLVGMRKLMKELGHEEKERTEGEGA